MTQSISIYNDELKKFKEKPINIKKSKADDFIDFSKNMITWTAEIKRDIERGKEHRVEKNSLRLSLYRPFTKQHLYFNKGWNSRQYQIPKLFPNTRIGNYVICVTGTGASKKFSVLACDLIADLGFVSPSQCFPLHYYIKNKTKQNTLFDTDTEEEYIRRDGVSDFILQRAIKQYGKSVTKEDIFYYVYGILHSPEYRETFTNDLKKMLPRIPLVETKYFWAFSKSGRALAELHINYEQIPAAREVIILYNTIPQEEIEKGIAGKKIDVINYKVQKMAFAKKKIEVDGKNKTVADKSTIIYNSQITITEIPEKAYEYVVNGKSAIEWILDRYQVKTDKNSGITNNPNDWANEVENPKYILELLLSVINISVQTVDIVNELPKLKFK